MPCFRSATVNLCPDDPALWQWEGEGRFVPTDPPADLFRYALTLAGPGRWWSVPRHVEPERTYELECEVRGRGRVGLAWVREGRPLGGQADSGLPALWTSPEEGPRFAQLTPITEVWSEPFDAPEPRRIVLRGVSPHPRSHQIA